MKRKIKIFRNKSTDYYLEQEVNDFLNKYNIINISYISTSRGCVTVIIEYQES